MALLQKRYANLEHYPDRHGKPRYYVRVAGRKRIPIDAPFGTVEFEQQYHDARSTLKQPIVPGESRTGRRTVDALCIRYYDSSDFKNLRAPTQKLYRRHIETFREVYGKKPITSIKKAHFRAIKSDMWDRPGACRNMLKRLTTLFNFAIEEDLIAVNPMDGVKLPAEGDGFLAWSDEDIATYLAHWRSGTRERLGLYLLLYTGQRRSDIVKMGWHSVRDVVIEGKPRREIEVVQQKGGTRLWIPLHKTLAAELDLHPKDQSAFLIDRRTGRPLVSEGFGNWVRDSARLSGIPGTRGPHGMRKAACRRLIEAGCTTETARAISGHADDKELKTYTKTVNQQKMAHQAMDNLEGQEV